MDPNLVSLDNLASTLRLVLGPIFFAAALMKALNLSALRSYLSELGVPVRFNEAATLGLLGYEALAFITIMIAPVRVAGLVIVSFYRSLHIVPL